MVGVIYANTFQKDEKTISNKNPINTSKENLKEKKKEVQNKVKAPSVESMDDKMVKNLQNILRENNLPKEEIKKLDVVIKIAIKNNLPKTLALSYYHLGLDYQKLREWQVALKFYELAEKKKCELIPSTIYLEIGLMLSKTGNYKESNAKLFLYKLSQKYKNVDLSDSLNLIDDFIKVEYAIAENYFEMKQYSSSIQNYEKIILFEEKLKNDIGLLECYSRISACYIYMNKIKKGISFYTISLKKIKITTQSKQKINESKEIVSKALRKKGSYSEDLYLRNNTLPFSKDGIEHLRLAQTYYKINQPQKAEFSIDRYLLNPSYNLIDKNEIEIFKALSKYLKNNGNTEKAYKYLMFFTSLEDTIKYRIQQLDSKNTSIEGFQNILQLEILRKDKEISMNAINQLVKEDDLKEDALKNHRYGIGLLLFIIVIGIGGGIYILRVSKQRRIANQKLALRSLRSQMNPHFIFNALNSVNCFISENDERSANKFLSEFSRLMRLVMENSEHDFISLTKELELLSIYLQLEHFRFKDKFEYTIEIDENIDEEFYQLPSMLIQPYLENAIWHGLRYKDSKGKLILRIKLEGEMLEFSIQDDGIGRTKSSELKTINQKKNRSTALKNINERISIFNEIHQIKIEVTISDLETDGSGTLVVLSIPQKSKSNA